MPELSVAELNIMAGTARAYEMAGLSASELSIWNRDFKLLCDDLSKLVDPELGADLWAEKRFYDGLNQIAKGYFDNVPFGGLKPATGQYGFRFIGPQDLKAAANNKSPQLWSWVQTVATTSGAYTEVANGLAGAAVYTCNKANESSVLGFHRLISYKPSPRLLYVHFKVNDYPYAPYCVEPFSKISKQDKLFKVIPMPGRIILHPGGKLEADLYFDLQTGSTDPTGTTNLDIEIALFGLVFGEHDYMRDTGLDATS